MKDYEALFAKAREVRTTIKTLLADDSVDMEQVKELTARAEGYEARAGAMKANATALESIAQPVMPVSLPTDGGETMVAAKAAGESTREAALKAVYVARYGEPDAAIKAIMTDLHGPDYRQKQWDHWRGFVKYMRTGRGESRDHMFSEREVAAAIRSGQDVWEMKTTMVEAQDTLGGYAVPAEFRADVISRTAGLTVVRQNGARRVQTSRDKVEMPKRTGGDSQYMGAVRVTWVDETPASASTSATNATLGLESIPVHTCMANTDLSRNLVEDAAFNIVEFLTEEFSSALAIDEDNNFLVGDGNGKPSGILRDSGIGALTTTYQVVSGNASALTWDGLIALTWGPDAQYRQNAKFIAEKATYEAIAKMQDGNGQYYWRQVYGDNAGEGGPGTNLRLLGYPVLEQEGMPTIGSGTFPVIFGDLYGYVIADRVGLSVERFIDGTLAATNQVRYLLRRRLGGQVVEPWRFRAQKVST